MIRVNVNETQVAVNILPADTIEVKAIPEAGVYVGVTATVIEKAVIPKNYGKITQYAGFITVT